MSIACTVVIPTYNRKESLRRTLDALGRQSLPAEQFEVVVVSDGSTDGTNDMLAAYGQDGRLNLRCFDQVNSGPAAARNRGVHEAASEVIVFVDDDVEAIPEFLERHLAHHAASDRIVVIGPMSPDPAWSHREPVWIAWEHAKLQDTYDMFRTGSLAGFDATHYHFYSGNASVRRRWLLDVGGFDVEFTRQEDVELAERLERICGLRFVYDFHADGLHHPVRSLRSWLRIPQAYGSFDGDRVEAGKLPMDHAADPAASRHRITRALTHICLSAPILLTPMTILLCCASIAAYRLGLRHPALAMLSAIYNVQYSVALRRRVGRLGAAAKVAC